MSAHNELGLTTEQLVAGYKRMRYLETQLTNLTGLFAKHGICEPLEGFGRRPEDLRKCIDQIITGLNNQTEKLQAINTPEIHDFLKAVELEAKHQRLRWGTEADSGKTDMDWFWLIGYLAGKALRPDNTLDKILHHIITTAAVCLNWHAMKTGNYTAMRPGIDTPAGEDL